MADDAAAAPGGERIVEAKSDSENDSPPVISSGAPVIGAAAEGAAALTDSADDGAGLEGDAGPDGAGYDDEGEHAQDGAAVFDEYGGGDGGEQGVGDDDQESGQDIEDGQDQQDGGVGGDEADDAGGDDDGDGAGETGYDLGDERGHWGYGGDDNGSNDYAANGSDGYGGAADGGDDGAYGAGGRGGDGSLSSRIAALQAAASAPTAGGADGDDITSSVPAFANAENKALNEEVQVRASLSVLFLTRSTTHFLISCLLLPFLFSSRHDLHGRVAPRHVGHPPNSSQCCIPPSPRTCNW